MILTGSFTLYGEAQRVWLEVSPGVVSVSAYGVQSAPLQMRCWLGDGSDRTAVSAYFKVSVEYVSGSSSSVLATAVSGFVESYSYTLPSDDLSLASANRISVSAYEDSGRVKEIGSMSVDIVAAPATPFPRGEEWNSGLVFNNGEYLLIDDVLYMWSSRVSGNTSVSPKEYIAAGSTPKVWSVYPYDKLLASQVLLAQWAKIGPAIFQGNYMLSQQGVDADGNASNDYRQLDEENPMADGNAFRPNILLDFLSGSAWLSRMVLRDLRNTGSAASPVLTGMVMGTDCIEIDGEKRSGIYAIVNGNIVLSLDPVNNEFKFAGEIASESGTIGGFSISSDSITSSPDAYAGYSGSKFALYSKGSSPFQCFYDGNGRWVGFGLDCQPAGTGITALSRMEDSATAMYSAGKIGLKLSISNANKAWIDSAKNYGNTALLLAKGCISGFRRRLRRVASSQTLDAWDNIIICVNTAAITITMPSSPEDGTEIMMCSKNRSTVNVSTADGSAIDADGTSFSTNRWHTYIYDAVNKIWYYGFTN